jgi:hypothetical protein
MGIFPAKKEITPNTILRRKPDLLFNEIDSEVIMLCIENSEYYCMDKVGSYIWNILEKPLTFKGLISKLLAEYEVSEIQCIKDTTQFLNKLADKNLIE